MQAWPSRILGLAAWSCLAGSQDADLLDQEKFLLPASLGNLDGGRQLSEFTQVCPNVRKGSFKACQRCLSNEMCQYDYKTKTQWICSPYSKTCVNPDWDGNQTKTECPEQLSNYSAWSAMCKYTCSDQRAPFSCSGYCLNEDYPCKWVPKCHATIDGDLTGMTPDSSACLRPCGDHDSMLQVTLKYNQMSDHIKTCTQAVKYYGCTNTWFTGAGGGILEHCATTCRTKECAWRCGRDELHHVDGSQCWQVIERTIDRYTCAQAISAGMDCHCKCAGAYLQLARSGGGSFRSGSFFGDAPLLYNLTVVANESFAVSLTGQAMKTSVVKDAEGPRMKLVSKGQDCRFGRLISGLSGIDCIAPPAGSGSASTASTCMTPPAMYTPYLHRWTGLKVNHCGSYDVCHCNSQCDLTKNWHQAGSLTLVPPVEVGSISKAMPGCARPVPAYVPPVDEGPKKEFSVTTATSLTVKIYGSIKEEHRKFAKHAAKFALVPVLKAYSGLLKGEVPLASDIDVEYARRRLHDSLPGTLDTPVAIDRGYERRMLDGCFDNDTAFVVEATKADVFVNSCGELLANINDVSALCSDASLQAVVTAGCQRTCSLCPDQTTSTTTVGVTMPPDVKAGPTTSFAFTITTRTDRSAANVLGRLKFMKEDPIPYLQRLFLELENTEMPLADIPARLWVNVLSGPTQVVLAKEEATEGEDDAFSSTTSIIFVILGGAIAGSCIVGLLFVMVWYCCTRSRNKHRKVEPMPIQEVTQISEGGYRIKKVQVGGEIPEQKAPEADCLERCWARCYKRCCAKKLKKARAFSNQATPGSTEASEVTVGSQVQLCGLSQAHYNGLTGTIVSGPNEKGRYEVDLTVVNDYSTEEHQTLSFKPNNMRVISEGPDVSQAGRQPGSYRREGAGMRPEDWHPTSP